MIPEFWSYGQYRCEGYGSHCMCFRDAYGDMYWYSYQTLVAYRIKGEFHIRHNDWGTTTGRHLNWIDPDKSIREDWNTFERNLKRLTAERKEVCPCTI